MKKINKIEKIILSLNPDSKKCKKCNEFRHPEEFEWIERFTTNNSGFLSSICVYCNLDANEIEKTKYKLMSENKDATVIDIDKKIEHARRKHRKYYTNRRREKIRRNNLRIRS